jgi:small subunit ribosomal protein S2
LVDFPIPSNDDASKAISFIANFLIGAIQEGLDERKSMKGEEKDAE